MAGADAVRNARVVRLVWDVEVSVEGGGEGGERWGGGEGIRGGRGKRRGRGDAGREGEEEGERNEGREGVHCLGREMLLYNPFQLTGTLNRLAVQGRI